ncbi:MAG: 50S ribosomal protein L23 [Bdellovibrionaceae bacterium]|nr:50S ribosomal protein L23 [Bdellovibrionales bacterium]MCB9084669.1 50S ribosomal protein L23 [Pseudobdellovibrionaceae bacterium]
MYYVIKRPLITEKNSALNEAGIYVFEVDREANKNQIKDAVEKFFRVKVDSVRTAVCRGRARRNRLGQGRVQYWKKAMVKLAPGEKITLFEGA